MADAAVGVIRYGPGSVIFEQGDPGDCAYFIKRGTVDIVVEKGRDGVRIARLGKGAFFGEMALVDGAPRSATAETPDGCELVLLDGAILEQELAKLDPFMRYWVDYVTQRIRKLLDRVDTNTPTRSLSNLLSILDNFDANSADAASEIDTKSSILQGIPFQVLAGAGADASRNTQRAAKPREIQILDRRIFYRGRVIFSEGEPGHRAYIVRSGKVEISTTVHGQKKILTHIGPKGLFGEMALIDGKPRSATAIAAEDSELLSIESKKLEEKISSLSEFMRYYIRVLMDRMRDLSKRVGP